MAIHRIEASKDFVIYTGEEGEKEFDNAFREILIEESRKLQEVQRRKELFKVANENKQKQRDLMRAFIKSLKK
jgi:hypothetical protein